MVRSTMTRAQQTGDHILSRMKKVPPIIEDDSMLEEGAPFPPEPPRKTYEPPEYVCNLFTPSHLNLTCVL